MTGVFHGFSVYWFHFLLFFYSSISHA